MRTNKVRGVIIGSVLKKLGYQLKRLSELPPANEFTMFAALKRCVDRGLEINTVIDVGASDGSWTRECLDILPLANYLLIEAQVPHERSLKKLKKEKKNVDYILAAAGDREGQIYFENTDLFGGLASEIPPVSSHIEVPVTRIDNEISKRNLRGPYLIKLDAHGYEIPILEGASEALQQAELVIIETYNQQLTTTSLKFYKMCEYMDQKGFSPIELVDFTLRGYDKSLWQMDTFFIPTRRKEFGYTGYE